MSLNQNENGVVAEIARARSNRRRYAVQDWKRGASVVAALLAIVGGSGCGAADAETTTVAPELAAVERRTLDIVAEAAGQIEPIRVVEVKSKASGEILDLPVETGDVVRRGDLLAQVDPRDVRNAWEQAKADMAVADARLQTSIAQKQRTEELRRANVVTEQELESAALDEANSRAQQVKAKTNLELAEERLKDVTITAPIDGVVIERAVEVGTIIASASQNVSGGTTLMKMADLAVMQVRALIDETDLGRIHAGQEVQVSVEAYPERRFRGDVLKIEPQAVVDQNVTMFPVLVQLDNSEGLLKPGMNSDVQIQIARREDAIVVPNAAIVGTRDAVAAGEIFGIDEETIRAAMRPPGAAQAGNGGATPAGAQSDDCAALTEKVRGGGGFNSLTEAEREKLRACMPQQQNQGGNAGEAGSGGAQRSFGQAAGRGGRGNRGAQQIRTGVVFVQTATGVEPRGVTLGLNDWEYTEVLRGVEPGDQVVIVSVARLQQAQQEFIDRMRERAGGGVIPGGTSTSTSGRGTGGPGR